MGVEDLMVAEVSANGVLLDWTRFILSVGFVRLRLGLGMGTGDSGSSIVLDCRCRRGELRTACLSGFTSTSSSSCCETIAVAVIAMGGGGGLRLLLVAADRSGVAGVDLDRVSVIDLGLRLGLDLKLYFFILGLVESADSCFWWVTFFEDRTFLTSGIILSAGLLLLS